MNMEQVLYLYRCGSVNLELYIYLYIFAVPDCLTKNS